MEDNNLGTLVVIVLYTTHPLHKWILTDLLGNWDHALDLIVVSLHIVTGK